MTGPEGSCKPRGACSTYGFTKSSLLVLLLLAFGFIPGLAQDKAPMSGQSMRSPQSSTAQNQVGSMTGNNMPMVKPGSHQTGNSLSGKTKPMVQSNAAQPSTMGGGMQDMMKSMMQSMGPQNPQPAGTTGGMPPTTGMGSGGQSPDAQKSAGASEHAKHHPAAAADAASGMAGSGGMGGMMAPMPGPTQNTTTILPAPQNSLEDQVRIQQLANTRMDDGTALMAQGIVSLSQAKQKNDRMAMGQATSQIKDGLFQVESSLSAQRALAEGTPPREVALSWFKEQMNLTTTENGKDVFGLSWLHFFVMIVLVVFAAVMVFMYFFKMRRAAQVLESVSKPVIKADAKPAESVQTKP